MAAVIWSRVLRPQGSFSMTRPRRQGVNGALTLDRVSRVAVVTYPAPSSVPGAGLAAWGLHLIVGGIVEPGVQVKLRLLDALDW